MPILRANNKIYYFSHIPKCGGSSIENYIQKLTKKRMAFLDGQYYNGSIKTFKKSSPQHILGVEVAQLFDIDFFDGYFAVVRDPYERFKSAFIHQKYIDKKIADETCINQFARRIFDLKNDIWGLYDNHFMPQTHFFYPGANYKVFKFENGLNNVKKYIDNIFNYKLEEVKIPHKLKQLEAIKKNVGELTDQSREIIFDIYRSDFENFKYQKNLKPLKN